MIPLMWIIAALWIVTMLLYYQINVTHTLTLDSHAFLKQAGIAFKDHKYLQSNKTINVSDMPIVKDIQLHNNKRVMWVIINLFALSMLLAATIADTSSVGINILVAITSGIMLITFKEVMVDKQSISQMCSGWNAKLEAIDPEDKS